MKSRDRRSARRRRPEGPFLGVAPRPDRPGTGVLRSCARAVTATGLTPHDLGLLDTAVIWPGETVRFALDFSQPFSGTQRYMLHCHNLEHEDMGMMITFAVDDDAPLLQA